MSRQPVGGGVKHCWELTCNNRAVWVCSGPGKAPAYFCQEHRETLHQYCREGTFYPLCGKFGFTNDRAVKGPALE